MPDSYTFTTTDNAIYANASSFINYPSYAGGFTIGGGFDQLGRNEVNQRIKTVRIKAGFVGQVTFQSPNRVEETIVWESKPKKTLAKAEKAARKAQLRALESTFDYI